MYKPPKKEAHAIGTDVGRTEAIARAENASRDSQSQSNGQLPPLEDAAYVLTHDLPDEPPMLISGILHKTLKSQIAGGSKAMKSWFLLLIAICVATGKDLLGKFKTYQAPVVFLNLEIPAWAFARRVKAVCDALGVTPEPGMLQIWNLRGHDLGRDELWNHALEQIVALPETGLVIVDPLYKLFNEQRDENKTGGCGAIMKRFDVLAELTGAATLFSHHFAKGSPANKDSIDRFSGSGVLVRDPDVYITMTPHTEPEAFIIELKLRCLRPVLKFCVRWKYPIFEPAPDLDPEELRKPAGKEPKHSVDDLVEVLADDDLTSVEFQKRCKAEKGMAPSTFYELLKKGGKLGRLHKCAVDSKWERLSKPH